MRVSLPNPLVAVAWLSFLLPGRFVSARFDFAFAVAVFAVACVVLRTKASPWETRTPARQAAIFFAWLQFLCVLSYLYALAFKGATSGLLDLVELPRWLLLGGFTVYLIRHRDASVRAATERAMTAALYGSWLVFQASGERFYVAALALCYLFLFSRSRLRWLHAAAATVVLFLYASRPSWTAWAGLLKLVRMSAVFGWGPARDEAACTTGSQFLHWTARGGVLGTGVIAAGLGFLAYRLLSGEGDLRRRAAVAAFLVLISLLLLWGPYLDSYRLFFMTAFLLSSVHEPRGGLR